MTPRLSILVPTLGRSPVLDEALRALAADAATVDGELVVVVPSGFAPTDVQRVALDRADRVVETPRPGFAAANNVGYAETHGRYVALVNDDAIVEPGWCETLCEALDSQPDAAATQGVVLRLDDPERVDGAGIAWNRWWQAVQIGHGKPAATWLTGEARPIFGVSATAAMYRRDAVDAVLLGSDRQGTVFDETLFAYYEDVDLAIRLRAAGFDSWCLPTARARHAGSASGRTLPLAARPLIHGNRHLVLARALGRAFWPRWPLILGRDVLDLARCVLAGDVAGAVGIGSGIGRALSGAPRLGHLDAPTPRLDAWRGARS
ncbi:MAG: glycosyltransferase family 2 protein [Acidobacteriota bacterium]